MYLHRSDLRDIMQSLDALTHDLAQLLPPDGRQGLTMNGGYRKVCAWSGTINASHAGQCVSPVSPTEMAILK
jgi:hypothetical protein